MMTPFKFQGCGLKGSGFKIFLIFLSWFRHGSIMGDLSRWNNRWIGLTRNFDINYVAIYTVRYRQFDMDSSLRKKYELLNKLLTIFLFFENLKRISTKTTVFLRFWHTDTVKNRSGISILLKLVAFGGNIINWFLSFTQILSYWDRINTIGFRIVCRFRICNLYSYTS